MSEVAPGKDDGLVEPEPVGGIKDALKVTSSLRDWGTHFTIRRSIKPSQKILMKDTQVELS